jgi:hypothetical protein
MTGHLNGTGASGNVNLRNNQIRDFCIANSKILYDFADIESYDPDGLVNYMELNANDNCDYDSDGNGSLDRNWALDWQNSHALNVDWWMSGAAHSQHLNGNRKGSAAWWLWATLAGWNQCVPQAPSNFYSSLNDHDISLYWYDNSDNEDCFVLERRIDNGEFIVLSQSIPANTTSYMDVDLAVGHIYTYRIKAKNSCGVSACSNETSQNLIVTSFELTISSSSGGTVTLPGEGIFVYPAETVVNLVATPDLGYEFVIWTGEVSNFSSPATTVTMNADKSVYANFSQKKNLYVADIAMSLVAVPGGKSARAVVTIVDNQGNPVPRATVKGAWSGLVTGSVTGTTGADGKAAVTSKKTKKTGSIIFTVTGISAAGYSYDPADNIETTDSILTLPASGLKIGAADEKRSSPEYVFTDMFFDSGSGRIDMAFSSCDGLPLQTKDEPEGT